MRPPIFIGIDGGGTKCRAVVFDHDFKALSSAVAGPANVAKYGPLAYDSIIDAVNKALKAIHTDIDSENERLFVSAGLAGVNMPSAARGLANWKHPFARFDYTTDLHAAGLGAHNGNTGAVLIVGTGSCAAALKDHKVTQFGGHGFILGDKGSGAWLGKAALSKTLEAMDGVISPTPLTERICQHIGAVLVSQIVEQFNEAQPSAFGALAPLVIGAAHDGDPVALAVVKDGADYLSSISANALAISPDKLVLVGGVSTSMIPWLHRTVTDRIVPAIHGPEMGAVIYQQMLLREPNMPALSVTATAKL
jgi:glucosamine kinase